MSAKVNTKVLVLGLVPVALLVTLFAVSFGNNPREVPSVLEGTPAPSFKLTTLQGEEVSLEALRGRPVVLNFWSTWCGPCKYEHPHLQAAARSYPGATFLGVVYSDTPDKAARYLQRAGTTYQHLVDPDGRAAIDYGVAGVPETFFIAPDGTIAYKAVGPVNQSMIATQLAPLLEAM